MNEVTEAKGPLPPRTRVLTDKRLARSLAVLRTLRVSVVIAGLAVLVITHGFRPPHGNANRTELFLFFLGLIVILPLIHLIGWRLGGGPLRRFVRENPYWAATSVLSFIGLLGAGVLPESLITAWGLEDRVTTIFGWCQLMTAMWVLLGFVELFREVIGGPKSRRTLNPAKLFVLSFVTLILFGTAMLALPRATAGPHAADLRTALFTATSAACVTGLTVEDTGTYWSQWGQIVILVLFQVGGLGIMTFGAFFALMVGRGLMVREAVAVGDLLESRMLSQVRQLVLAILVLTVVVEAAGAVLLSGLWRGEPQQVYYSVFHSVSAFCNAGFALMPVSFEDVGSRFEVWGVLASMIIVGGLGFAALFNVFQLWVLPLLPGARNRRADRSRPRPHLQLTTRLVLITSLVLLVGGTLVIFLFGGSILAPDGTLPERLRHAWFQSVTCRTAGFNTVPLGELDDATLFVMILLMFVGASPGSTGGGVKTVAVAVSVLALVSILRGRRDVEVARRTIPDQVVRRSLLIVGLGMAMVTLGTLILVAFEGHTSGRFIDHLFEVTSALSTVGLSTGVTSHLSPAGQFVIIVSMFAGRVGPLTLMLALAGRSSTARYRYPEERVLLT